MVKPTNSIDKHIGVRVRRTRLFRDMSQEDFAIALGVSVHRVKKYESGFERIGAGQLAEICRILQVRPSFFFANLKVNGPFAQTGAPRPNRAPEEQADLSDRLAALGERETMRNSPIFGMLRRLEEELRAHRSAMDQAASNPSEPDANAIKSPPQS